MSSIENTGTQTIVITILRMIIIMIVNRVDVMGPLKAILIRGPPPTNT